MSNVIFEAGDIVTCAFFGDEEFIIEGNYQSRYPLYITRYSEDATKRQISFTQDGKLFSFHTSPVLKLVRKKTKKRTVIELFKVDSENESFFLNNNEFGSYEDAFDWIKKNGIPSWEYQIEKFYKVKE